MVPFIACRRSASDRPALFAPRSAVFLHYSGAAMVDRPATTYVVSVFEKPHWRTVLTTKDKQKAFDMAKEIGDKVRIQEITPLPKKR